MFALNLSLTLISSLPLHLFAKAIRCSCKIYAITVLKKLLFRLDIIIRLLYVVKLFRQGEKGVSDGRVRN